MNQQTVSKSTPTKPERQNTWGQASPSSPTSSCGSPVPWDVRDDDEKKVHDFHYSMIPCLGGTDFIWLSD